MKDYGLCEQEERAIKKIKRSILKNEKIVKLAEGIAKIAVAVGSIISGAGLVNAIRSADSGLPMLFSGAAVIALGVFAFAGGYSAERRITKLKEDCKQYERAIKSSQTEEVMSR